MATWKTDLNKVQSQVTNVFTNAKNGLESLFNGTSNRVIADVQTFFQNGNSVVGIKVSGIPNMQNAINEYVNGVDNAIAELRNAETNIAFKGDYAEAVKSYIEEMINACKAISSQMKVFNDELTEIQKAYEAKDTSTSQKIRQEAESASSNYQTYQSSAN